ncbi:MAG: hypothetical protein M1828_006818 [Chrysothrix sp. TS-e1954]|nr:MAG: hypothetical protein M1828_006818 [Chrysothrix sp. TS-e1954]
MSSSDGSAAPAPAPFVARRRRTHGNSADVMTNGTYSAPSPRELSSSRSVEQYVDDDLGERSMTFTVDMANATAGMHNFSRYDPSQPSGVFHGELPKRVPHHRYDGSSDSTAPGSAGGSAMGSSETAATSIHTLPPLQSKGLPDENDQYEAVEEDDPANFDLLAPPVDKAANQYSLETRGEQMFSREHLQIIFEDPALLLKFTSFLGRERKRSVPLLIYYLDALKALRAVRYANAVVEGLDPLEGHEFTQAQAPATKNAELEERARQAFEVMVREDLPAYVTHTYIKVVSMSIQKRITGTLPPHLREASEGLAEVFCLSDPSRPDNPIVMASEEFHRTTQYGMSYAVGRNCRFLQGPKTNFHSVKRLKEACVAGKDHSETFVNYRRDGSPFLNLLMIAPLRDSRGKLRYFIGAQVDVSGLAKEATDLEGLQRLIANQSDGVDGQAQEKDEFQELSEMLNINELDIVRKSGGRMHQEQISDADDTSVPSWHRPRLLLKDQYSEEDVRPVISQTPVHGKLSGVYEHYMLVRPAPSLRILFTSPSLRVPGILQSPFMNRIGSSERVRDELVNALTEGRGVTAKVKWVSKNEDEGRNRWIHCTPLLQHNGSIGVWMIVLVDDDTSKPQRRWRQAPPVANDIRDHTMASRPRRADDWQSDQYYSRTTSPSVNGGRNADFNFRIQ